MSLPGASLDDGPLAVRPPDLAAFIFVLPFAVYVLHTLEEMQGFAAVGDPVLRAGDDWHFPGLPHSADAAGHRLLGASSPARPEWRLPTNCTFLQFAA